MATRGSRMFTSRRCAAVGIATCVAALFATPALGALGALADPQLSVGAPAALGLVAVAAGVRVSLAADRRRGAVLALVGALAATAGALAGFAVPV